MKMALACASVLLHEGNTDVLSSWKTLSSGSSPAATVASGPGSLEDEKARGLRAFSVGACRDRRCDDPEVASELVHGEEEAIAPSSKTVTTQRRAARRRPYCCWVA